MLKILIVDDGGGDLILAEKILRRCQILNPIYQIRTAAECVRHFEGAGLTEPNDPCLVFLDMMMPISGLELLRVLHQKQLCRESLIVMLSGITDIKLIQQGYELGARAFLVKPLTVEDVVELLVSLQTRIHVEKRQDGNVLHWVSTPLHQRASDTELIREYGRNAALRRDAPR